MFCVFCCIPDRRLCLVCSCRQGVSILCVLLYQTHDYPVTAFLGVLAGREGTPLPSALFNLSMGVICSVHGLCVYCVPDCNIHV